MRDVIIKYSCGYGYVNGGGLMGDFDVNERIVSRNVMWVRNRWGPPPDWVQMGREVV
jgi:hypothetical protein